MLSLLRISNIALIAELEIEFGEGLTLLTGETGSGKSIIVDSLAALRGERVSSELIKQGAEKAEIEGIFATDRLPEDAIALLRGAGIEAGDELIVRRELSLSGKNRVFVSNSLVTFGFLQQLGGHLADIHGQGEQAELYNSANHCEMLDRYGGYAAELDAVSSTFAQWSEARSELSSLEKDVSEKLQLIDVLRFQVNEITAASLRSGEDEELEAEKIRLVNVEKLTSLSREVHSLLYDDEHSALAGLDRAARSVAELAQYDKAFSGYDEGIDAARAVISELGATARDYGASLEHSPGRLDEIEDRLAELTRLKRKYGESIDNVLAHLAAAEERLETIVSAEFHEADLRARLEKFDSLYIAATDRLSRKRKAAAREFEVQVTKALADVALDKARFEVRFERSATYGPTGTDLVEFYFSANPGEAPRPLAKVASGGEASRLMLILKTAGRASHDHKTAVFDEIDIGIGGRVAEAVGRKLRSLSTSQQVLCVTHQPQIASLADHHIIVEKDVAGGQTSVSVRELNETERIDEIARMLAGEQITDAARENAKAMLAAAG